MYATAPNPSDVSTLAEAINVNPFLATLLLQRGITSFEDAKSFFRPKITDLPDPFIMQDMEKGVDRLEEALSQGEKILFYGDYDVDGTTSVALMMSFFRNHYPHIGYYIPDRYAEGYGVSLAGIDYARKEGYSLIITLDCGVKAHETIGQAAAWGIDTIVCDHHRPEGNLPPALAILNPQRPDCPYPSKELCGCGVGFKLLEAFCKRQGLEFEDHLFPLLDLVAIAIAADIVPIVRENRVLAHFGLQALHQRQRPGLETLFSLAGVNAPYEIADVVFYIAPRINAAGRISHARKAVELFLATDPDKAEALAQSLHTMNQERKQVDQAITAEALEILSRQKEQKSTVLFKSDWHKGIVGIVASRCIENYHRPTIILTESNNKATGSARSVPGFDIYKALHACTDLLDQFGGHTFAAGLTLPLQNVEALQQRFEEIVQLTLPPEAEKPQIVIDLEVPLHIVSPKFYQILKQMAPFGPQNLEPILVSKGLTVVGNARLLKDRHIKATISDSDLNSGALDMIGFNMEHFFPLLQSGKPFSMAYTLQENHWRGQTSLQLRVKDIRPE